MAEEPFPRQTVAHRVDAAIRSLAGREAFRDFLASSTLAEGDLVLVNNSFIYRDTVKTTKSSKYVAARVEKGGGITSWGVVSWDHVLNVDFKHLSARAANLPRVVGLDEAVADGLPRVGRIVFSLIGAVGERPPTEVSLPSIFKVLRYDSTAANRVARDGNALVVNTLANPESLWENVEKLVRAEGVSDSDFTRLASQFGKAFDDLREQTPRLIRLNAGGPGSPGGSLLGQIAFHMGAQISEYERALGTLDRDPSNRDAYNNILRISYNFASDAIDLVTLFVSICDLKPLVQWLTVAENHALAEAFRRLPFGAASARKPSLKSYADVVGGARNHAFHDFFAFDRPFEVDLSDVPLQAHRLLLFHAHRRAPEDAFDYEDRELIEVLRSFSRAPERSVSMDFWLRNLDVLRSAHALTEGIGNSLRLLWSATSA